MNGSVTISAPELLHIIDHGPCFGADQEWYHTEWQRRAGCGPTSCSHLMWYLSRTRPGLEALCRYDGTHRAGFVQLMEDVWTYVTPGRMGVNSADIFTDGAVAYAADRGIDLEPLVLPVPVLPAARPGFQQVTEFLAAAFRDNLPVAFLNLSNGKLRNLDNWHWVTLVGMNPEEKTALMYDQRKCSEIGLELWLRTTTLGGAFVTLRPDEERS